MSDMWSGGITPTHADEAVVGNSSFDPTVRVKKGFDDLDDAPTACRSLDLTSARPTKGVTLRKFRTATVAALCTAAAVTAVTASSALAGTSGSTKIVPFTATYAGAAVVKVTDQVADISTAGAGKGTPIGVSKISGKGTGDAAARPCVPFAGTGSIVGLKGLMKGAKINFKMASGSAGCGDEAGEVFSVTGRAIVTGGAGAFKKAKGTLKLTGLYDRTKGTFAIKLAGKLTV